VDGIGVGGGGGGRVLLYGVAGATDTWCVRAAAERVCVRVWDNSLPPNPDKSPTGSPCVIVSHGVLEPLNGPLSDVRIVVHGHWSCDKWVARCCGVQTVLFFVSNVKDFPVRSFRNMRVDLSIRF